MGRHHHHAKAISIAKLALLSVIYGACLLWVLWWLASLEGPKHYPATKYLARIDSHVRSRFFRTDDAYGSAIIYQSAPFIVVAMLSFAVIELRKMHGASDKGSKEHESTPSTTMRTYPVIVRSPMGVLTMADALFIAAMLFVVSYTFTRTAYLRSEELNLRFKLNPTTFKASLRVTKIASTSYCIGRAAMIPFSLLWIPVSRGSPFLRLIRVPFEQAVKYHIWLSTLTLFMLTLHGSGYIIYYAASHRTHKIIGWEIESESCSVVAGVVALCVGLTMSATSLSFFRRRWYELFFGFHHLYMVFFLFWLYHVVWTVHIFIVPVLLFMVDRFLRMLQSRRSVDVLSARLMDSGSLHLRIAAGQDSEARGLEYHALSSWYIRIPSLARLMKLQWHAFSIASTPMDGKEELSIVIKPFGKWTANLRDQLFKPSQVHDVGATIARCPFSFKAGVEGPYGDESNFYLKYKVLILVGGGIGITPLLALLRDVLHRQRLGQKDVPSCIQLYHCVRKHAELCVLNSVDPNGIVPEYERHGMSISVSAYITSHSLEDLPQKSSSSIPHPDASISKEVLYSPVALLNGPKARGVSSISSKGESVWVASTTIASMIGFYVLWGLSNVFIIKKPESDFPNYSRTHLVVASMMLGTTIFGGMIVSVWWLHLKRHQQQPKYSSSHLASISSIDSDNVPNSFLSSISNSSTPPITLNNSANINHPVFTTADTMPPHHEGGHKFNMSTPTLGTNKPQAATVTINKVNNVKSNSVSVSSLAAHGSPWNGSLQFGCRPCWNDIFATLNEEYRTQDIGVLVSGPSSMRTDIAFQCKKYTRFFGRETPSNVFHYHPISFDL